MGRIQNIRARINITNRALVELCARRLSRRIAYIAAAAVCAALLYATPAAAAQGTALRNQPQIGAGGAVLMDMATTRVLAGQNAHARLPMASTTKIMTALLAIENCPLDEVLAIPEAAYGMEGSSMYLHLGEKITMRDLIHGLMLSSGNDAAVAIALRVGGSLEGFAQMMNNRAIALGCVNTNFVTPNGLHDEQHYTSAYDLALIACAAMKNGVFREVVGTQYYTCESGDVARTLKNKNKILWNYGGGNGIKTGYTKAAGKCLAFSAEREGNTLIGIVLNCPDMWGSATTLLDYGFENHAWEQYALAGEVKREITVQHGMKSSLEILVKEDILVPLRSEEGRSAVELRVSCPAVIEAPVFAGQKVGVLEAWADGRLLCAAPLVAAETVMRKEYIYYIGRLIKEFSA